MIDTHTHLEESVFDKNREEVILRALNAGIKNIINIGTNLTTSKLSLDLASKYREIYTTIGIHPHYAQFAQKEIYSLYKMAKEEKVVAVGEIGLDYYKKYYSLEIQIQAFKEQIDMANELSLPIVIHNRGANKDIFKILEKNFRGKVVLHFFSQDKELAQQALANGYFISFSGIITYKNQNNLEKIIKDIPLENILTETDSPYASPFPMQQKCNEPLYLKYIIEKIALIKELSFDDIVRITSFNAKKVFHKIEKDNTEEKSIIAYSIRNSLYLNITNQCTNKCIFCVKRFTDYVKGYNLRLAHEPTLEEVLENLPQDFSKYKEVVFCGYGEPLIKLDMVINIAKRIREKVKQIRINTNGQGNLIHQKNILPFFSNLIDVISISLNTPSKELYNKLCQPDFGLDTYEKVIEFIVESKKYIKEVIITVIDLEEVDLEKCKELASKLEVKLKIRKHNECG